MQKLKRLLAKNWKELLGLSDNWQGQTTPWESVECICEETHNEFCKAGFPVDLPDDITVESCKMFFAKCRAALKDETNADTLNIEQAAKLLGCRPKTLRKLVDRTRRGLPGGIRFHQVRSHSLITFRRAWIDEFLAEHSQNPTGRQRQPKSKPLAFSEF